MTVQRNRLMQEMVAAAFEESIRVKERLRDSALETIGQMADLLASAFRGHHRLFVFGNGGSAADSQHLAAELINRFQRERMPLPALALTVDTSVLTSIGNDYGFVEVFRKQLQALAGPGDVALGISTSGRSSNVVEALKWARQHGLHTIGWTGEDHSDLDLYCDLLLHVPSRVTAHIQEAHITVAHVVCQLVDEILFGESLPR